MFKGDKDIGCIIQARMTSKRFPGKSVVKLFNIPLVCHVVHRVIDAGFDDVIVAIPTGIEQEPIVKELTNYFVTDDEDENQKQEVFIERGDENDVLLRYYEAAKNHHLKYIIRVTADCPLIEPLVITDVVNTLISNNSERRQYVSNVFPFRNVHKGWDCEGFTFKALKEAHIKAITPADREHVTPWMQSHYKSILVQYAEPQNDLNLCVDFPFDIQRLETMLNESTKKLEKSNV